MKNFVLILGNQLFHPDLIKKNLGASWRDYSVLLTESPGIARQYRFHKQRIAHCFSSMRHYAEELRGVGFHVHYSEISIGQSIEDVISQFKKIENICYFEWENQGFENTLKALLHRSCSRVQEWPSPQFVFTKPQFEEYLKSTKKPFMKTFYEQGRRRLNVLMDETGQPYGGQFSYDSENRKRWDQKSKPKSEIQRQSDEIDLKAIRDVKIFFPDHPGSLENILFSTTRSQARQQFSHFVENRLAQFGDFEDAIEPDQDHLFHSMISADLNLGWLTPREVLGTVLSSDVVRSVPLNSLEGFVRQVMGWREFVRGIFNNFGERLWNDNVYGASRTFGATWLSGKTGLVPLDDAIKKFDRLSYNHHIERLMIHSNLMNLCEIHPHAAYEYFMEQSIDSYQWVMAPNVMGMGLGSSGDLFATKPYISGSNYILKMSHYKQAEWCEIWDGLYWRFIQKHSLQFAKNPRMSMMVATLKKMDSRKKERIFSLAEQFIQQHTIPHKD